MRKFICFLLLILITSSSAFASQIPEDLQSFVTGTFPKTTFRFDGVIILPDSTVYLPLFPAKSVEPDKIDIKSTIPSGKSLSQKPEVVIFNNEYVFLKVINSPNGKKTVLSPSPIPEEISNGLLPQDMLVPNGLMLPETLKNIVGNLRVDYADKNTLKISVTQHKNNVAVPVNQLKNKMFYVATGYAKDIQVLNSENKSPVYALKQNHIPNDMKGFDNQFLLVTYFDSTTMNIISLFDEQIIKQIHFETAPEQILIDENKKIAYISSPTGSSIYVVNLENMTLSKQIKINGMCEKLTLSSDGTKLFYFDKKTNEIWAIELDNDFLLKNIGTFPNVSKIVFDNNKIYITSRTKGHLAIVDYSTNGLLSEISILEKPVDMLIYNDNLFVLGATENIIQVIDTKTDELTDTIYLNTKGFSTKLTPIANTELAIVSDSRASMYCVLDMVKKQIVKVSAIDIPIRTIIVNNRVKHD